MVEHRTLEACIGTHVLADLLAHPAGIAIGGKRIEQNPEGFPGPEPKADDFMLQQLDRREVADEGQAGPKRHRTPGQMLGRLSGRLADAPWLAVQTHAGTARTFDVPLDPHEDFGIDRLRAGKAAPDPAGNCRNQKQQERTDDQQTRQIDEILRPQHDTEKIELAGAEVEQHCLPVIPLQPGQAVEHQLGDPDAGPAQAGVTALRLARIDLFTRGVHADHGGGRLGGAAMHGGSACGRRCAVHLAVTADCGFDRLQTYAASTCTLASPRNPSNAGMTLLRPLRMVSMMVSMPPP